MPEAHQPESPELRGLYRHVKISVRTLDIIIVAGIAAMIILVLWSASGDGYTVRFDARGGSDVAAAAARYGETVAEPAPPERNGYAFGGWYVDEGYSVPWDFQTNRVEGDLTLFARWIPEPHG